MFLHNRVRYLSEIHASLNQIGLSAEVDLSQVYMGNQIGVMKSPFHYSKEFICKSIL